jgi:hypothetical protein
LVLLSVEYALSGKEKYENGVRLREMGNTVKGDIFAKWVDKP